MKASFFKLAGCLLFVLVVAGCIATGANITSTKTAGVDRIPGKIGFYPLLSTPVDRYEHYPGSRVRALSAKRVGENVVITPPVEFKLSMTQESQILTGMISTQLSTHGFSLKELPVEVLPDDDESITHESRREFVISLNLLEQLREEYGLQALIIGNAFFLVERRPGFVPEKRVISAHIKIIDIESLDVLAQVNLPYDEYGEEMIPVADAIASELARMAGFGVE